MVASGSLMPAEDDDKDGDGGAMTDDGAILPGRSDLPDRVGTTDGRRAVLSDAAAVDEALASFSAVRNDPMDERVLGVTTTFLLDSTEATINGRRKSRNPRRRRLSAMVARGKKKASVRQ